MRQRGRSPRRPLYQLVADDIRSAIASGMLAPGRLLPPERVLAERYDVSLVAVRQGLSVLRSEGLIVTERGRGSRVLEMPERVVMKIPPGATIGCRLPTAQERAALSTAEGRPIPEGVPVFVVEHDGRVEVLPGDRVTLETTDSEDAT